MGSAILAGLLLAGPALAQPIVNIEDRRIDLESDGLYGSVNLDLKGKSGNSRKSGIEVSAALHWKRDHGQTLLLLSKEYGESGGIRDADNTFFHLRHTRFFRPQLSWEAFAQWQNDVFKRLEYRTLLGGGMRSEVRPEWASKLVLGAGIFYERESLESAASALDAGVQARARLNLYTSWVVPISSSARWRHTLYAQPDLADFGDLRLSYQSSILVDVTREIKFSPSLQVTYESRPADTLKTTDVSYQSGLIYQF